MVRRGEMGDCGGGWLEHPRPWLGAQWPGLALEVPSCPEPPGALLLRRCRSRAGALPRGHFAHAVGARRVEFLSEEQRRALVRVRNWG